MFSGGYTVKRLIISLLIVLMFISFANNDALAQRQKSIHQAIIDGETDQVKSRISAGEDVNTKNRMSWTPLHTAIRHKKTEIIQFLLDKGADINARDSLGKTPLHLAVETGQKEVVEKLIAKGAQINVMDRSGDNALSLANKNNQTEIAEILKKNGAQEPNPQDLFGERLYGLPSGTRGINPNANNIRSPQSGTGTGNAGQSSVVNDILADPNEIKTRVKSFKDLEKSVKEVSDKSQNELRQWQQARYDNRTTLARYVDKQFDDEIDFIRKVAVEESAKKTVEAIDNLRTARHQRSLKINRELLIQKREQRLSQTANTRTRGRTTGRNTRGGVSTRGQTSGATTTDTLYGPEAVGTPRGGYGSENDGAQTEQLDPETQQQLNLWLQATPDNKLELAREIHPIIQAEIGSIRAVAVEEKAKKTTAAIDGVLLARQERFDQLVIKLDEERRKLQEAQSLRDNTNNQNQAYQQNSRYGGRTSRRGTQRGNLQQQNSSRRTRGRRR
jgi:hypothetical protein